MKKLSIVILVFFVAFTFACKDNGKKKSMTDEETTEEMEPKTEESQVTLTEVKDFPDYKEVTLALEKPSSKSLTPGKQDFKFKVSGMKLGEQTKGANELGMANADEGQHIHFILDNEPYMAFYEDDFDQELKEGTHTLVAFPARSYHMSVKNKNAVVATKFQVGDKNTKEFEKVDFSKPTLVYSRPKGDYNGVTETNKVLLDFYLLNTDLSKDGNKVQVTVNGKQEFTIDKWAPYVLEGLPSGKNTIELELVDKNGKQVEGNFTKEKRDFNLN